MKLITDKKGTRLREKTDGRDFFLNEEGKEEELRRKCTQGICGERREGCVARRSEGRRREGEDTGKRKHSRRSVPSASDTSRH